MEEGKQCKCEYFWERKIIEHWQAFVIFLIGCITALAGAIWVLFWFIETSSVGNMGAATIGEWSIAWIWEFFIFLILWELLIVGVPVAIAFGVGWYLFWKRLSDQEKAELKEEKKRNIGDHLREVAVDSSCLSHFQFTCISKVNSPPHFKIIPIHIGSIHGFNHLVGYFLLLGYLLLLSFLLCILQYGKTKSVHNSRRTIRKSFLTVEPARKLLITIILCNHLLNTRYSLIKSV